MAREPKTILIVEDEPDTAEMIAEMLRLNGYRIIKSYAGAPAVNLITRQKPAAVVLDLMMPDISGLEVLHFMRNDPEFASTPVIVVSAKTLPSDIRTGMEAGASVYLTKPVAYLDFKSAVEDAFHRVEQQAAGK